MSRVVQFQDTVNQRPTCPCRDLSRVSVSSMTRIGTFSIYGLDGLTDEERKIIEGARR
jgi:hypothetical protein